MKKYIFIIGGLIIAVALVLSVLQWNKEVDTTTEKAKEDLTNIAEQDPQATGKLPQQMIKIRQQTIRIQTNQQKDSASETRSFKQPFIIKMILTLQTVILLPLNKKSNKMMQLKRNSDSRDRYT